MTLPRLAMSVRQPWAYAIVQGWKDIENRSWRVLSGNRRTLGEICIHASKGMTQDEYEGCADVCGSLGFALPPAHELPRGGIVGTCRIVGIVKESDSPWFFGPRGLVIADARVVPFIAAKGALDFFEWHEGPSTGLPRPARWMLPRDTTIAPAKPQREERQLALL